VEEAAVKRLTKLQPSAVVLFLVRVKQAAALGGAFD
jgi:hypothetical protein